ncbi:MAG: hypothetical protein ACW968_04980 [Candidatus Thorarchaeota archaeon]
MGRYRILLLVAIPVLMMPFAVAPTAIFSSTDDVNDSTHNLEEDPRQNTSLAHIDVQNGVLDPVDIWQTGTAHGFTQYQSGSTDVEPNPTTEVWLPAGAPETYYSADCYDSGFFLVGPGGSADFSSPAGTLSWWGKWDGSAPHGRFWGQHGDFELRWSSGRMVLDWGIDTSLTGSKSVWLTNHWYFFAIVWDEPSDFLAFYWGDETTLPQEDAAIYTWTSSVVGLHIQNDIMNSITRSAYVDGHVDDFRYYDIPRSLVNISGDYRKSLSGIESGLIHYYMFENDLSDTAGGIGLVASGGYAFSPDVFSIQDAWRAEELEINVMNLRNLYALNGSFDSGIPGANVDWFGDGTYFATGWLAQRETSDYAGRQRASYDAAGLVTLGNEGYFVSATNVSRHYNDTRIFWYQNVDNSQLNELFEFEMNYLYQNGPIGENFTGVFKLKFEVRDGTTVLWNWSTDLVNSTQRQVWFNTGPMLVNITGAPSTFQIRAVLEIITQGAYVEIPDTDVDLDGDSTNGIFVSVLIDDVSLIGATPPSCESVDLSVSTVQTGAVDVSGTDGAGIALLNYDSWNKTSIPITFSSNSTISFDYSAKVSEMKRLFSSLSSSSLEEEGVAYSVESGQNVNLTMFTYVASYPEAEDLGLIVFHPASWDNVSIEDPFGDDDPGPIGNGMDYFEVPAGGIDSAGWWILRMQGPNYAKDIRTQKFAASGPGWIDETVFRTGDIIRCQVTIATASDYPTQVLNLESELCLPSHEIWASALMNNVTGYILTSGSFTFGSYNATVGGWTSAAFWENGSAVAFGHIHFEVYHRLTMFPHTPSFERNLGENFTAAVYIHDQETGEPILNENAIVVGNWSGGSTTFNPNLAKGWWEADFNTSQIGVGIWVMKINATIPYFDATNCTIDIQVMTLTVMTTLGDYYVEISPGGKYLAKFRYMFLGGTGIDSANVFVATWSGPEDGIEYETAVSVPGEPGNYTIEFTGVHGGTYFITVTGLKEDHSTAATSFYLIVGAISTELGISSEELPDELYYNQTYTCTLFYSYGGSIGIEGASVNFTHNPVAIVDWIDTGSGYYQFSIRVPSTGSFSVYVRIQQFGYVYADVSFFFDVAEVPTTISEYGISEVYYESRTYDLALYYNSTLENGVEGATLTPSISIRALFDLTVVGNGWYNFTLTPALGDYNATLWLTKPGYQERELVFRFSVSSIPVILSPSYPINQTYSKPAGSILNIRLSPIAGDTGQALTEAEVEYVVEYANGDGNSIVDEGTFVEVLGVYTANITVPSPGLYLLRITILKDNFQFIQHDIVLSSEENPGVVLANYVQAGLIGALALFGIIFVTMLSRRLYQTSVTNRNLELLALKGRLEDVRNLIGILVIHNRVGLPIYSNIIKGGFEESMLSSFITAITHFRSEFKWDEAVYVTIPISEVIAVVLTETLICAIITVDAPTETQKQNLENFGRVVGEMYDEEEETVTELFTTPELVEAFSSSFDPFFDRFFDGRLLKRYVGFDDDSLPGHLNPLKDIADEIDKEKGSSPDELIKNLIRRGYGERHAHKMIFEVIDNDIMLPAEETPPNSEP